MEESGMDTQAMFLAMTVVVAAVGPARVSAITCPEVDGYMIPCIGYLLGVGDLRTCCGGVSGLNNAAQSTPDRRAVCGCLQNLAGRFPSIAARAAGIPDQCGVRIPYAFSPTTDCNRVEKQVSPLPSSSP
ncbi:non-specific lipid-transfer protein [Genlisea aurea]|uniref:Non-specific lipid-transfer protein n=1 Tax=Genlisea aurea TaxID=192259 RepID=S8D7R4_9LAMI|nr:non-specific lipid-transfer protein [Genlisea aurea]